MKIKFLHTPIEQLDQLCRDEENVKVTIAVYNTEHYNDDGDGGPSMLVKTCDPSGGGTGD